MAAVSWKNLTQEQRQGYIQMFHSNEEDPGLDILPEPLPGVNNESRAERVGYHHHLDRMIQSAVLHALPQLGGPAHN